MKTTREIDGILRSVRSVDVHVHTHLCDGKPEMTVENIAATAKKKNIGAVVLMPHFHRQVSDGVTTLYTDTDESIFLALRDEIDSYSKRGDVKVLLSTEADILSQNGDLSLSISAEGEHALDFVTPTMNYSLVLPMEMVKLTSAKSRDILHESGEYARAAAAVGGAAGVLEAMYECEANALLRSPYPCMLGHFFAAHSLNSAYTWFGAREEHLPVMRAGAAKLLEACRKTEAMVDLTGLRFRGMTAAQKQEKDGFLYTFQREFVDQCRQMGIPVYPGSDGHELEQMGEVSYYYEAFSF